MNNIKSDESWTLFLDRDGVINRRIPDSYVMSPDDFEFLPGVRETISRLSKIFRHLIVVTNQQGIGKGLMTVEQLHKVHDYMLAEITRAGGRIDRVYFCRDLAAQPGNCRKPAPVMAYRAQTDFSDIDFQKSIMVGDTIADVAFGNNLGMQTILVGEQLGYPDPVSGVEPDFTLKDLREFGSILSL